MNGRGQATSVDGVDYARSMKRDARETLPDSPDAQRAFILGELATLLKDNVGPNGKPWPAAFWRGLGKELSA
jgi:hypothetical protein